MFDSTAVNFARVLELHYLLKGKIQKFMRHIVLSFMASLVPPHFSTLSQKRHDFPGEKKSLNIKCEF